MEVSIYHAKPHVLSSSLHPFNKAKIFIQPFTSLSFKNKPLTVHLSAKMASGFAAGCAKWESSGSIGVADLERELEAEMNPDGEDWMSELGKLKAKCKESKGVVELLECLGREAIMGDDEGREPLDYNRRALIFDKSARVFQALKERNTSTATPTSQQS